MPLQNAFSAPETYDDVSFVDELLEQKGVNQVDLANKSVSCK
jgi:hypothetical protein